MIMFGSTQNVCTSKVTAVLINPPSRVTTLLTPTAIVMKTYAYFLVKTDIKITKYCEVLFKNNT